MCIIIAKNKNSRLPKESELKQSFEYNSDGAGFMYVENGQVVIDKGYMDYKSFISHYNKLLRKFNNFENKSLVIHCRIGTSGGNTRENTHPYPISNSPKKLHSTKIRQNIGIAHNGVIRDYGQPVGLNDTQEFIIKYIYPLYSNYKKFYKNKEIMKGIQTITSSKFAILDKFENIYYIGDFVEEEGGIKFSNTTYRTPTYKTYKSYYDYYDDYDSWWDRNYKYQKELDKKEIEKVDDIDDYELEENDIEMTTDELFNSYFVKLEKNWIVDYKGTGIDIEEVGDKDLWFDYDTYLLYEYKNGKLCKVSDSAIIYDERFQEMN